MASEVRDRALPGTTRPSTVLPRTTTSPGRWAPRTSREQMRGCELAGNFPDSRPGGPGRRSVGGMEDPEQHDHDRGLAFDLATLSRRRTLALLGGGALALLVGCGSDDGDDAAASTTSTTSGSSSGAAVGECSACQGKSSYQVTLSSINHQNTGQAALCSNMSELGVMMSQQGMQADSGIGIRLSNHTGTWSCLLHVRLSHPTQKTASLTVFKRTSEQGAGSG